MIKIIYSIILGLVIVIGLITYDIQSITERPIDVVYKIGIPLVILLMIYHMKYKRRWIK